MVDQFADRSDGDNANRPKDNQGYITTKYTKGSIDKDGSPGAPGSMESMVGKQASSQGADKMNPAMEFKNNAIALFEQKASGKYDRGQIEHGGYLPFDVIFQDIEDEIIDMWFYVQAMKVKVGSALGEKGRRMFFVKENYSTIEGMIRQSTNNALDK
tara:strand:+ start:1014 stop:1484 length:471 start_codon:yes stop_codon:yes gene_type:complete